MTEPTTPKLPANAMRNALLGVPLVLLVAAGYYALFPLLHVAPQWGAIGFGALGWVVALALRGPVIAATAKMEKEKATPYIVGASGPAEELVRLAAVLWLGRTFPTALSIGFGWGAIEILFGIINGVAAISLLQKDDEKARQAVDALARQGKLEQFGMSPFWGMFERIFATGLHVGFTLLVTAYPWTVVTNVPIHSLVNLSVIKFSKDLRKVELLIAVVGTAAMLLGLAAFGKLG